MGKNINLFLMDGDVTGIIKCTLSNWTGVIYKIPRKKLAADNIRKREHLKQSGIYFLLGSDEELGKNVVYVGQAGVRKNGEGLLNRIIEHTRNEEKDFFNEVIALTTTNDSFGPTEISYLENKFTENIKIANRYFLKNGNEPNVGNVTEEKEAELDEIIANTEVVIGALGNRMFVPIVEKEVVEEKKEQEEVLYLERKIIKTGLTIKAKCKQTNEGFVVLKGSMISEVNLKGISSSIKRLRTKYLEDGVIEGGILKEDQLFTSPSSAASFVIGSSANGRTYWKNKAGKSIKDLEEELLK